MSDKRKLGVRAVWSYWKQVIRRAWDDTEWFTWGKVLSSLGVLGLREIFRARAGLESLPEAAQALIVAGLAYAFIALVAFLCNIVRAPARIYSEQADERDRLQARLAEIELTKPKAILSVEGHKLVVFNDGATGNFRAELYVLSSSNWATIRAGSNWQALWPRTQKSEATIYATERADIRIGTFSPTSGNPGARLSFWYFNVGHQKAHELYASYLPQAPKSQWPQLRLRLSLFSDPPLIAPITRELELNPEGLALLPDEAAG
jgi:hypothetical protein